MKVDGDTYDYFKVEYTNSDVRVIIICKIHGEFKQLPSKHKQGRSCRDCSYENRVAKRKYTTEECVQQFIQVHGDTYDYSKFEHKGSFVKGIIICKKHGEFKQTPPDNKSNKGCPDCGREKNVSKRRSNKEKCIEQFIKVHGNEYDYSLFEYKSAHVKGRIACLVKYKINNTQTKAAA